MRVLRDGLEDCRRSCHSPAEWKEWTEQASSHRVLAAIREDPFVNRAYSKPRGYAGDAVMLDFIYRHPDNDSAVAAAPSNGRASLQFSLNTPAPCAVRNRRDLLAQKIDEVCSGTREAEILSLACGHLREARCSRELSKSNFRRFLALDQDCQS